MLVACRLNLFRRELRPSRAGFGWRHVIVFKKTINYIEGGFCFLPVDFDDSSSRILLSVSSKIPYPAKKMKILGNIAGQVRRDVLNLAIEPLFGVGPSAIYEHPLKYPTSQGGLL
jgi:hypothetical protein